ncbi:MAG: plsY [Rhizobacter sp.]|nr:plsY [Rhizobacter sp.]
MQTLYLILAVLAAYALGSLSFAVIVSRVMGLHDPRTYGSQNPGATNVLRSGNRRAAVLTLLLDAVKGYVPVMLAVQFGARFGIGEGGVALIAVAAFVGHLWPVFFHFKGGKGVATAGGVMFGINPWLGLAVVVVWAVVAALFRYASLASIAAALFAAFFQPFMFDTGPLAVAVAVMALLLMWRHGGNIAKLLAGTENKIGHKPGAAAKTSRSSRKVSKPRAH